MFHRILYFRLSLIWSESTSLKFLTTFEEKNFILYFKLKSYFLPRLIVGNIIILMFISVEIGIFSILVKMADILQLSFT